MDYLAVKDFEHFQHYKNRNPPWVKFYFSVLEDYTFLQLAEVTQRHLTMLWLLASRYDGFLPDDRKYLATAIKARGRVDFDALIATGFLRVATEAERDAALDERSQSASTDDGANASDVLASRKHSAMPSRARESKRQSKREKTDPSDAPAAPRADKSAPWMGGVRDAVTSAFDGAFPKERLWARALRPKYGTLPDEDFFAEVAAYCEGVDDPGYVNPTLCAECMGTWRQRRAEKVVPLRRAANGGVERVRPAVEWP